MCMICNCKYTSVFIHAQPEWALLEDTQYFPGTITKSFWLGSPLVVAIFKYLKECCVENGAELFRVFQKPDKKS